MSILVLKTIHIFGFVAWFAGLFYLVRMFVYHTEAYDEDEPKREILKEQFHLMELRVYKIICTPAFYITWIAGVLMIVLFGWDWFRHNTWLHIKLFFLLILTVYHFYCKRIIARLRLSKTRFSSTGFRLFNEVPTLLLILISALAVFKNGINYLYLILTVIFVVILLILLTKLYKYMRDKNLAD